MSPKAVKYPALNVAAATAELVKGILALYSQAQIIPRVVSLEDEEISMEVRLPVSEDELSHARDQIHGYGADWRMPRSKGSMSAVVEPAS